MRGLFPALMYGAIPRTIFFHFEALCVTQMSFHLIPLFNFFYFSTYSLCFCFIFALFSINLVSFVKAAKKRKMNAAAKKEAAILKKLTGTANKAAKRKPTATDTAVPARVSLCKQFNL